ncbi:MAG: PQQ-binding-like beta-propeller repeat protein [Maioricimonas sp. JB049]
MNPRHLLLLTLLTLGQIASATRAENWPRWRGPHGDGTSGEQNVPLRWDGQTGANIAWKTPIPGTGHGSPVVWNDAIFLVSCLEDQLERILLCIDARTGEILWQQVVVHSPLETRHTLNSYASCTPATDGELVYVAFLETDGELIDATNVGRSRKVHSGQMVVAAYDFEGQQRWLVRPGGFISVHGFCSNPVLYENLVIVNGDHDGDSYIVALDRQTGKTVWKRPRAHKTRSYVTPIIREIDGRTQLVFSGSHRIVSLDPRDGSLHWEIDGPTEQFVASMVDDGEKFYMAAGFPTHHVMAIRPDGQGNVTDTHVAWHSTASKCYVPSPAVAGGYLFVPDDRGTASAYDTATGERVWRDRLGRHFSASLVTAADRVYFTADDGTVKVLSAAAEPELLAENPLGENCYASPAISDGQMYFRGEKHLFCVGEG